jgi:uncharacterized protein (DUF488 family)
MDSPQTVVYSIGHSNHTLERFVELLRGHGIGAVADVRSTPYSKFAPWSARRVLAKQLSLLGIRYVFLGEQLGGRPEGDEFEGVTDRDELYRRIAQAGFFKEGIDRLQRGTERFRVAMLCSEEDPSVCHRHNLITPELRRRGFVVGHIRRDGSVQAADDIAGPKQARTDDKQATQLVLAL